MGLSFIVSCLFMLTFSTFNWFQYWSFTELKVFCARKFNWKLITGFVVEELKLTGVRNQQWWVDFWIHLLLFLPSRSNIYLSFFSKQELDHCSGVHPWMRCCWASPLFISVLTLSSKKFCCHPECLLFILTN